MRMLGPTLLLIASLAFSACGGTHQGQPPPTKWTTGFWFWHGSSIDTVSSAEKPEVLFVHVGTISQKTSQYFNAELPEDLPEAREYWFVFRFERQGVPGPEAALILTREANRLRDFAQMRHLNVAGVQLDIDSPTRALARYADFIRQVRKGLAPGLEISITALLDWFRDGTAIDDVIQEADEFVPQFYDVATPDDYGGGSAIAAKFDAAEWAPKFNRFQKRYRIGISTFGRARFLPRNDQRQSGFFGISSFADLTPLDIASNPAFTLSTSRSQANELVLNYEANAHVNIGYNGFEPGEVAQFILPTPDAVRSAVTSAKLMRGYCTGVVFFRWPASNETLTMQPDEVLKAADLNQGHDKPVAIDAVQGACVAVNCVDLFLANANPLSAQKVRYRIRSSSDLEYFLPEERLAVRMLGPSELELSLPAYSARGRLYIGRAVSTARVGFSVTEEQQ
jgi:hypothetical protein